MSKIPKPYVKCCNELCICCAGNFRRGGSLRLRGEKMVQNRSDVRCVPDPGHRQRSHSFISNAQIKPTKSCLKSPVSQESPQRRKQLHASFHVTDNSLYKDQTPRRCRNEMQDSFTDSGHFDDLTNSSLHSEESVHMLTHEASCMTDVGDEEKHRRSLISFHEKKVEDLERAHVRETQELKKAYNDKVEGLLKKLEHSNTRYSKLLPIYNQAKEKILALEKQLEDARKQLDEESKHKKMYLQTCKNGVEEAKFELEKSINSRAEQDQKKITSKLPVSVGTNLKQKLSMTDSVKTPPGVYEKVSDDKSLHSYGSAATAASVDGGYPPYNGTTFSGRSMCYVLHCSSHAGLAGEEYLTPTQRAQRENCRLKSLLTQAKKDIKEKNSEIFHLTEKVLELQYKPLRCSTDENSKSSEMLTIKKNSYSQSIEQESPQLTDVGDEEKDRPSLISFYRKKIEDLMRAHEEEIQELRKVHNEKVEALLQELEEAHATSCEQLLNYEQAKEGKHTLEKQPEDASKQLEDSGNKKMDLQLHNKGIEAAKFGLEKDGDASTSQGPVSRSFLCRSRSLFALQETTFSGERKSQVLLNAKEAVSLWVIGTRKAIYHRIVEAQKGTKTHVDPVVIPQICYLVLLTNPENHQGHLNILSFTDTEKQNIRQARAT